MSRSLALMGVEILEHGAPAFTFLCDCASVTRLVIEGLELGTDGTDLRPATVEFAFTCDGCGTAHWLTVFRPAVPA